MEDAAAHPPSRVLILSDYDPGLPAQLAFTSGVRSVLDSAAGFHVVTEYLDRFALQTPAQRAEARDWIRARNVDRPQVVLAVGAGAIRFVSDREANPWPDLPVVFGMIDRRLAPDLEVPADYTGTTEYFAARETVELALRLFPDTRRLVLVTGAAPLDHAVAGIWRRDLAPFAGRFEVSELVGLTYRDLAARLAALPERSVVLVASYLKDGSGQVWAPAELVTRIAATTRAPMFSTFATALGKGIVGGVLVDWQVSGQRTGELAKRVLAGEAPSAIAVRPSDANVALVDGRQLDRFGVPDSRVPDGVEIRFREPSRWYRSRWLILAAVSGLACQSLLIAILLVERRRRRLAEARSREDLAMIAHLNRVGAIAELAGAFAHEINSPLGAVVNNAQAARRFALAGPDHADDVAACLDDVVSDARRAGEVVKRIRGHLRREDVAPVPLEVAAVVRDAIHLVRVDAMDRGVALSIDVASGLPRVNGDDVQLVQVVLNLVVNALDAVADLGPERRRVDVRAEQADGFVEIRVADAGRGIPPAQVDRIFAPFFTTKRTGLGMGLAISRSIVEAHGGRITVTQNPDGGTVFHVRLPAAADRHGAVGATA